MRMKWMLTTLMVIAMATLTSAAAHGQDSPAKAKAAGPGVDTDAGLSGYATFTKATSGGGTLQTPTNEAIEVVSQGVRKASETVTARLMEGDQVGPDEYYFRTLVRLATAAPRLSWLNDLIAVSTGDRERSTVRIHIHEVL